MNIYLAVIIGVILAKYAIHTVADMLNVRNISPHLPAEFADSYDADSYAKSQAYLGANTRFDIFSDTLSIAITLAFILAGGFNHADRLVRAAGLGAIPTGMLYTAFLIVLSQLMSIPLSAYETFVIEEKFGFNKTSIGTFVGDILKGWLLMAIIGMPILAGVLWFFTAAGTMAWLYCWIAITVIQLFLVFIAPVVIMPLFNKFTLLEAGELRSAIEAYAQAQNFRMKGIFKIDGSRRSSKSNAFFTGFGTSRRIALFDTLIDKHSVEELVSIVAHEMGHYKKKHVLVSSILAILSTGLMLFLLQFFLGSRGLFNAFDMEHISVYAGLVLFGFLYSPISFFISLGTLVLSRKCEYAADRYAVDTYGKPESMISALKQLSVDNLSNLTPHPVKVALCYSHPPMLDRIAKLREMGSKTRA